MPASWLVPEKDLTLEQQRAVTLSPKKPRVIFGPPGSGKTITLVHRAKYLLESFHVQPDRYMVLAFTNALKDYIRPALEDLGIDQAHVSTFDNWCKGFHEHYIGNPPRKGRFSDPEMTRQAVHSFLTQKWEQGRPFDFVLVDEGHDLDWEAFEILTAIAEHVTVFIDHKQQIYSTGCTEHGILRALGLRQINMALLEGFRCTPYISELAANFIQDPEQAEYFRRQTEHLQPEQEQPLLFVARDYQEEMEALVSMLEARQGMGERIAVLFPERWQAEKFPEICAAQGQYVEGSPLWPPSRTPSYAVYDFGSDLPKAMTYHSAKGLTFDTVFMPRLVPRHFSGAMKEKIHELLFVGVTRAVRWVYLSSVHEQMIQPVQRLYQKGLHSEAESGLSIKHGNFSRQMSLFEAFTSNGSNVQRHDGDTQKTNNDEQSIQYADMF